jgi:putative ABC transport system substrate-binding protein
MTPARAGARLAAHRVLGRGFPNVRRRSFIAASAASLALLASARSLAAGPLLAIIQYNAPPDSALVRAYLTGLSQAGLAEGSRLRIERRYLHDDFSRLPGVIAEVAALAPQAAMAAGHDIAKALRAALPQLRIVTAGSEDPVLSGLVRSIARPGGNVTGVTFMSPQVAAKRLELLKLARPNLTRVAVLWDPTHVDTYLEDMRKPASQLGLELSAFEVRNAADIDAALKAAATQGAQALFVVPSRLTLSQTRRVAAECARLKMPSMAAYASYAEAGGLMAYGADAEELLRRAAVQTRKILEGTNPGEIPMEQAQRFELVVNRRVARALGADLPQALMVRADRVIE